ncbi:AAA family ATPase [Saccharothrix luteola]|uniref:AAA family ATPase n=1 Tax=Saccharothrix luteola TaxID=2893018 RepID=UPI001E336EDD|nr:AAA family ATPase [Saccharothrix luteola]MCC8251184.1 AAA family ATPase [Saccharothrix luteola]
MSGEERSDRLIKAVRLRGVDVDSAASDETIVQAVRALAEAVMPDVLEQCDRLLHEVDDDTWKTLLVDLPITEQRRLFKSLGLPGDSKRRPTLQQQAHFAVKLRGGLNTSKDLAGRVAHDLTRPVRDLLLESASKGTGWLGKDGMTSLVRALAVALCPQPESPFLAVSLTWLEEHDAAALDLLLVKDISRAAIREFWEAVAGGPEEADGAPAQLAEAAHQAVERAVVTCRSVLSGSERGLAPTESDLAELTAVRHKLLEVASALEERSAHEVEPALDSIDAAVQRITRSSDEATVIRMLLGAEVPGGAAKALEVVLGLVNGVLDRWPPATAQDRADAELLTAVVRLALDAAGDDGDDSEVEVRYEQLRDTAPKEILPLLTAAVRGRVVIPPEADATAAVGAAAPTPAEDAPSAQEEVVAPAIPESSPKPRSSVLEEPLAPSTTLPAKAVKGRAVRSTQPPVPPPVAEPQGHERPATTSADCLDPNVVAKAVAWFDHGQFALAHHLLQPHDPALAEAAGLAALAFSVIGPGDAHEPELDEFLRTVKASLLVEGNAARSLTTGAALTAAVMTGSFNAGNLLVDLADHMDDRTGSLARAAGELVRRGMLAGRGVTALASAGADDEVLTAAAYARERAGAQRQVRLPRGAAVLARLRAPAALPTEEPRTLGDVLLAAADDRRAHVQAVKTVLGKLNKTSALERLIDADAKAHRQPAGKVISGAVRQEMLSTLREDVAAVERWVEARERHSISSANNHDELQLGELKATLLTGVTAVAGLMAGHEDNSEPLAAAAARAARAALTRLADLIGGNVAASEVERLPFPVLDFPLLSLSGASWDSTAGRIISPGRTSLERATELLDVPDTGCDLVAIALAKADADDFATGAALVALVQEPQRGAARTRLAEIRTERVTRLKSDLRETRRQLLRAGIGGFATTTTAVQVPMSLDAVTEAQLVGVVDSALSILDEPDGDVRTASQALSAVESRIVRLRQAEAQRLHERLDDLADRCPEEKAFQIRDRIARGRTDLADDDLAHLESGDYFFHERKESGFEAFYPAGVDVLAGGIDDDLISAVRNGSAHPALPVEPLSEAVRDEVANGLQGWVRLRAAFTGGWQPSLVPDTLLPSLRLVGLDIRAVNVDQLTGTTSFKVWARGRRYLEVEASITGDSPVPALGSIAKGRYRLLVVWNEPTTKELDEWREADQSSLPLIICYLGTLSAESRLELAALWWDPSRRAAVLLDDALLTWIATRREKYDAFVRLSLPFSATQPFRSEKTADVPAEMFYGREQEKGRLLQPGKAPSIIYGGRGMGKSALMHEVESEADGKTLVVVWFEVDRLPGIDENPDLVWAELAQRLTDKGVGKSLGSQQGNLKDAVPRSIQRWLDERSNRRLLILLDEAEGFVDGDAPKFSNVSRLLDLKTRTKSRCQVVFAGLHSVQHYSVGNSPLSPTGHLRIGPLGSQPAYDLVTQPLAALGYRLDVDDAQQILLHCSYQPYLIQLVAEKLLNRQFASRGNSRVALAPPPWRITTSQVVDVLSDAETRRELRRALKLTLDLDVRTKVITNVLALHAYEYGQEARMPDPHLFTRCREAWPRGFEKTDFDAFRQLLDELAGLGILADASVDHDRRGIRNETVLRALGTRDELAQSLELLPRSALPVRQARELHRPVRATGDRRRPLVNAQLAQLLRKGNIAKVVVGSEATWIDQVVPTLHELQSQLVNVDLIDMKTLKEFKTKLETGSDGNHRSLVIGDLRPHTAVDTCLRAYGYAVGGQAGIGIPQSRGASRAAVLVAGLPNLEWLRELAASPEAENHVMSLQRYDPYTLPLHWRGDGVLERLADDEYVDQVLGLTDGWPLLVELIASEVMASGENPDRAVVTALDGLREAQSDPSWCRSFLEQTGAGLGWWDEAKQLTDVLVEYDGPCAPKDLSELTGRGPSEVEVFRRVAGWFGLLSSTPEGDLLLSPLVTRCFRVLGTTE